LFGLLEEVIVVVVVVVDVVFSSHRLSISVPLLAEIFD